MTDETEKEKYQRLKLAAWKDLTGARQTSIPHPYFSQGFAAGYSAAAGQWVKIESADDLPKETNDYLWLGKPYEPDDAPTTEFFDTEEADCEWWIENYVAYMPIPPFTE